MSARQGTLEIQLAGEAVTLDPRRALIRHTCSTVVIADPHIGKDDTFRRAGIPVPASVASGDFNRLAELLTEYKAERLVVLGDFFHARQDADDPCIGLLRKWRQRFASLDVLIVRGNHDWHAGPPPSELGLVSEDEPVSDDVFVYRHFPLGPDALQDAQPSNGFVLAGHQHPGVTVSLGCQSARRLPCFHVTPNQAVLPAFGRFTGTGRINPASTDRVFAAGGERVIELPAHTMV